MVEGDNCDHDEDKDEDAIYGFICCAIAILSFIIISNEIFLQRNPISGISGSWNAKDIVIATMTGETHSVHYFPYQHFLVINDNYCKKSDVFLINIFSNNITEF